MRVAAGFVLTISVAVALLASCAPALAPVGAANLDAVRATRPWATNSDLVEGRSLFAAKCGSCHGLPLPASHPAARWPSFVDSMAPRSGYDTLQARKILDWVLSAPAD